VKRFGAAAVLSLTSLAGCARHDRVSAHPPIVVISIDTLRADHLPAYGYRGVETPGIDSLRKDSILYENAYSHVPLTLPSHAVLLTGLLPYQNGVRDNIGFRLAPSRETLASALKARGYATGAAVSTFALRRDRGLAAGFDFYDDEFAPGSGDERPGLETVQRLERWMEANGGRPLFAFLHLYEPHAPYSPPEPFRTRYAGNLYDGEIAAADQAVAAFLSFLRSRGLYDPALVLFLSDHGEGLNDHGEEEHGVFLYRESIRVPLLVKLPGSARAGATVHAPVGLADVFPTIAEIAGISVPADSPGLSLAPGGRLPADAARRIYSETLYPRLQLGWSDLASLTDGSYQYIEAPRPELYDLVADPSERKDLAAARPPAFRTLRLALEALKRPGASPEKSTPEELEKLGSLGYISVNAAASGKVLPDPKDRVAALKKYKALFALFYARRDQEAVALAREILSEDPGILSVSRMMAASFDRMRRPADAERVLQSALARSDSGGTREDLGQAYDQLATLRQKMGDAAGAEQALREAILRNVADEAVKRRLARILLETGRSAESLALLPPGGASDDADSLDLRGSALAEAGRGEEARKAFLAALERDPGNAAAPFHLGMLSLRESDPSSARLWFEKSLAADPHAAGALAGLGLAQAGLGDQSGALDSWARAIALDPKQYQALFNRSVLAGRLGNREEARRGLERFLATAPRERYRREREEARRLLRSLGAALPG
jgi:choline-sulfatase